MSKVELNGMMVIAEWPARLAEAQLVTHYTLVGKEWPRIPYGWEADDMPVTACRDCAAARGELHVPGCAIERCPHCRDQAFCCGCPDSDESTH